MNCQNVKLIGRCTFFVTHFAIHWLQFRVKISEKVCQNYYLSDYLQDQCFVQDVATPLLMFDCYQNVFFTVQN